MLESIVFLSVNKFFEWQSHTKYLKCIATQKMKSQSENSLPAPLPIEYQMVVP